MEKAAMLETLKRTLINFVKNPFESWGEATDGRGNAVTSIFTGKKVRVSDSQGDRNTARINSGTYTPEQRQDFTLQLKEVERTGGGTACFSGDADNLPASVPERTCAQCGKTFRSASTDADVNCYACCLDRLCPVLPGAYINACWSRDDWRLEVHGDIGVRNVLTFLWHNHNSCGNVCHQGLVVYYDEKRTIRKLVFSTVAREVRQCYTVTFDLEANSIKFSRADKVFSIVSNDVTRSNYAKFVEVKELDGLVLDLMWAMLPSWMLYKHRPRNPANGCFA